MPNHHQQLLCWEYFETLGKKILRAWEDAGRPTSGPVAQLLHDYRNMCHQLGRAWPE